MNEKRKKKINLRILVNSLNKNTNNSNKLGGVRNHKKFDAIGENLIF